LVTRAMPRCEPRFTAEANRTVRDYVHAYEGRLVAGSRGIACLDHPESVLRGHVEQARHIMELARKIGVRSTATEIAVFTTTWAMGIFGNIVVSDTFSWGKLLWVIVPLATVTVGYRTYGIINRYRLVS
jgi:hypothetical protein